MWQYNHYKSIRTNYLENIRTLFSSCGIPSNWSVPSTAGDAKWTAYFTCNHRQFSKLHKILIRSKQVQLDILFWRNSQALSQGLITHTLLYFRQTVLQSTSSGYTVKPLIVNTPD